jgi:hypothetical protein
MNMPCAKVIFGNVSLMLPDLAHSNRRFSFPATPEPDVSEWSNGLNQRLATANKM